MNAKDKLIEKLLRSAKKHKVLTYPVLALVAIISFFGNLFNWHNGTGKRVVAIIMVMVMFVSQSYFLTSSATSLVDTEEEALIQKELQDTSVEQEDNTEESKEAAPKQEEKDTADTEVSQQKKDEDNGQTADTESEEETVEENIGTPAVEGEDVTTEVADVTDADVDADEGEMDEEKLDYKLEGEDVQCIFYFKNEKGERTKISDGIVSPNASNADTYDVTTLMAGKSYINGIAGYKNPNEGGTYRFNENVWYYSNGSLVGDLKAVKATNKLIEIYCTRELAAYDVTVLDEKVIDSKWGTRFDVGKTSYAPKAENGIIKVEIDEDTQKGTLNLTGIQREGYELSYVKVDGTIVNESPNASSVTVDITGNGASHTVTLGMRPVSYTLEYQISETDTRTQTVYYDGIDKFESFTDVVEPPMGRRFDGEWKTAGGKKASGGNSVFSFDGGSNALYTAPGCTVNLEPVYTYTGVKLNRDSLTFEYKIEKTSDPIQIQYDSATNPNVNGENFTWTIDSASENTLKNNYGITCVKNEQGYIFESAGPTNATGGSPIEVRFHITDSNMPEDVGSIPDCVLNVYVEPMQLTIDKPADTLTTKYYDGTTDTNLGNTALTASNANGTVKIDITYTGSEYDTAEVDATSIILKEVEWNPPAGESKSNYVIVQNGGNYVIPGKIQPRIVYVKPTPIFNNGKSYVRAGEANPSYSVELVSTSDPNQGIIPGEPINWLDNIEFVINRPTDLTAEMSLASNGMKCTINHIDSSDAGLGKNYKVMISDADRDNGAFEVIMEDTIEGRNYSIDGSKLDDNEWYYGDSISISAIANEHYDTVLISTDGGKTFQPFSSISENDANADRLYIRLKDSATGAITKIAKLNLKYDSSAPEFDSYTFTQKKGDKEFTYSSNDDIPNGGLYFPGIGGVMDFGTYTNSEIELKVKYSDSVSGLKTLYYGLFGVNPTVDNGSSVAFDKNTGYATIKVLADAVRQVGTIKCFAVDEAGNKSGMIQLAPKGNQENYYEWSVEVVAPKITSFSVMGRIGDENENQTIKVNSSRQWYNHCYAELTVSDATAGLRQISWYINGTKIESLSKVFETKETDSVTVTQPINESVCDSNDSSYEVYAEIEDNAGNIIQTDTISFKVDDEKPELDVRYSQVWKQDKEIEFFISDALSGVDYAQVIDSNGVTTNCSLGNPDADGRYKAVFEISGKGEYTVRVVDKAGNIQTWTENITMISDQIPDCPGITVVPAEPDGENGWYKTLPEITIENVKMTEDNTPVDTWYKMWLDGEQGLNETRITGDNVVRTVSGDGIYNIKAWSVSASGVSCAASAEDEIQVKVDTVAPDIDFTISKGNGASILINFTVKDTGSGVNKDTIKVLHGSQELVAELTESDEVYTGSFEVTSTGNYSIVASDNAGNEAKAAAFTPMSMKVKAVTNISASSATLGANVYRGTFDIANVSIAYRKLSEEEFTEAQSMCVKDEKGNEAVSVVLSDLTESTDYVFKVTAVSDAPSDSDAGEVLEYEGYFKTLSSSNSGISVKGTARYATSQEGEITVGVFEGNVCVMATEVNAGDEFTFNNVPDGNYSIVATDGVYSKTMRLLIQDGVVVYPTKYIDLILSGKNTAVVITSSDTPNVTADNMDSIFEDDPINFTYKDAELIEAGGTVEFKLYASLMTVSGVSADEISAMYAVTDNNKIVGAYLDLSLYKIVTDVDGKVDRKRVTELARGANVSVTIPLGELAGKSGLEVVRIHDTGDRYVGTSLQDMDNNPNTYTITTSQFSTYAVLYDPDKKEEPTTEQVAEQTTEAIKDGTSDPASNGNINSGNTSADVDPDSDDTKTDKNESGKNSSGVKTSSVGSLRSSGTAKTGDTAPVTVLGFVMFMSMAGFIILKRKNQR